MIDRLIDIPTAAGRMDTFITHPDGKGPFPPVVVFMDVWGHREELFDVARRIATVGYWVALPNFYYRDGKVRHEFRDATGRMISLDRLSPEQQKQVVDPLSRLTDAMAVQDTGSLVQFMDRNEPVRAGPIGSVGYCLGGRLVFRVAAAYPDRFQAGASLHGTLLVDDTPHSPHLGAPQFQGEMYCGFAEKDHYAPPSTINTVAETMKRCAVRYSHEVHAGSVHGYALPDRDIHHKEGANRDWERMFAMWRRVIPPVS